MKPYDDNVLTERDLLIGLPSIIVGISVFSLPNQIANVTEHGDGWFAIVIAGIFYTILAIFSGKLAAKFPGESFFSYASLLVTKPIAIMITFSFGIISIFLVAYVVRSLSFIAQQYLFVKTPMEVLALAYMLVVIYAVTGTRAGIFRLNLLFLPIGLVVFLITMAFNVREINFENFLPLFKTDVVGYGKGFIHSINAFTGGSAIFLFYTAYVKKPNNLTKIAILGIGASTVFYIAIFLISIGIFGNAVTSNLNFPTVEFAKRAVIPGGVLERVDSLVFTVWIMTIFNTTAMLYDLAVLQFSFLFKLKKVHIVLLMAPIIFYIAMFFQTRNQIAIFSNWIGYISIIFGIFVIILLYTMAMFRRRKDVKNK